MIRWELQMGDKATPAGAQPSSRNAKSGDCPQRRWGGGGVLRGGPPCPPRKGVSRWTRCGTTSRRAGPPAAVHAFSGCHQDEVVRGGRGGCWYTSARERDRGSELGPSSSSVGTRMLRCAGAPAPFRGWPRVACEAGGAPLARVPPPDRHPGRRPVPRAPAAPAVSTGRDRRHDATRGLAPPPQRCPRRGARVESGGSVVAPPPRRRRPVPLRRDPPPTRARQTEHFSGMSVPVVCPASLEHATHQHLVMIQGAVRSLCLQTGPVRSQQNGSLRWRYTPFRPDLSALCVAAWPTAAVAARRCLGPFASRGPPCPDEQLGARPWSQAATACCRAGHYGRPGQRAPGESLS